MVLATADLHYGLYPAGDRATEELARHVCDSSADALVIAGDLADVDVENLAACLELFNAFDGLKLLVPGNHDLWTISGSSEQIYREELPRVAREAAFHVLDTGPVVRGDLAFIGSIGWYDYSFRNPHLGLSTEDYRRKSIPGLCSWNDRRYVRWDMEDEEFTELCLSTLRRHYSRIEPKVDRVVCVLHHVPFAGLLYETGDVPLEFCRAYMGSERFGQLLLRSEKVCYVICGHRHGVATCQEDALKAFVVGSDYSHKRLLELDLDRRESESIVFRAPRT